MLQYLLVVFGFEECEGKVVIDLVVKFMYFCVGNKNVKLIYVDGKVVWVGIFGGVVCYDMCDDSFKFYDVCNGLFFNGMFFVGKLKGQIVVGIYGGGLFFFDDKIGKWKIYNILEGLGDVFVYGVIMVINGDVWIVIWFGVNCICGGNLDDCSKWDLFIVGNIKGGLLNDWVYGLVEGRNGEIWLVMEGGMVCFVNNKWENWNYVKGFGVLYEKVKKDMVYKSDFGKQLLYYVKQKEEMGLGNVDVVYNFNYVVLLVMDKKGDVWVGIWGGGLLCFDGKKWVSYIMQEGLFGNYIFMLYKDEVGCFWIGMNNGLI